MEKKNERKKETTLPTFQPQVLARGLPLQAVRARGPSQVSPGHGLKAGPAHGFGFWGLAGRLPASVWGAQALD